MFPVVLFVVIYNILSRWIRENIQLSLTLLPIVTHPIHRPNLTATLLDSS